MNRRKHVCFLPDDFRYRRAQRRTNKLCAAAFLLIMAILGFTIGGTEYSLLRVGAEHEQVNRRYALATGKLEHLATLQATQSRLARQATAYADLLQNVPRSYLIAEVTNALPAEVSLVDLSLSPAGAGAADKTPDTTLRLTGLAGSDVQIAVFVNQLSRSSVLRDVNLLSTTEDLQSQAESRRFVIGLTPDGRATLAPAMPAISSTAVELAPD